MNCVIVLPSLELSKDNLLNSSLSTHLSYCSIHYHFPCFHYWSIFVRLYIIFSGFLMYFLVILSEQLVLYCLLTLRKSELVHHMKKFP